MPPTHKEHITTTLSSVIIQAMHLNVQGEECLLKYCYVTQGKWLILPFIFSFLLQVRVTRSYSPDEAAAPPNSDLIPPVAFTVGRSYPRQLSYSRHSEHNWLLNQSCRAAHFQRQVEQTVHISPCSLPMEARDHLLPAPHDLWSLEPYAKRGKLHWTVIHNCWFMEWVCYMKFLSSPHSRCRSYRRSVLWVSLFPVHWHQEYI